MQNPNLIPYFELKTKRLLLRKLKKSDIQEIFSIRSNDTVNKYIERKKPKDLKQAKEFIKETLEGIKNNKWIYWAISLKDYPKLIGTICLWNFSNKNKNAEIGFELSPEYHGKGIMNEAVINVIDFGFKKIKLDVIEAFVHKDNLKSIRILKKNNFILDKNKVDKENINNIIYTLKINI